MKTINTEEPLIGKKVLLGKVEAFCCPKCHNHMVQQKASKKEGKLFIFKCETCKGIFKVELNNIKCVYCKSLIKKDKAFEKKYCSLKCYNAHKNIHIKTNNENFVKPKTNICHFCKNGICKNDENHYYYGQNCTGDCDYFCR